MLVRGCASVMASNKAPQACTDVGRQAGYCNQHTALCPEWVRSCRSAVSGDVRKAAHSCRSEWRTGMADSDGHFNRSTQHKPEIVVPATGSRASYEVAH